MLWGVGMVHKWIQMTPEVKIYGYETQVSSWPFDCFCAPNLLPGKSYSFASRHCNEMVLHPAERKTNVEL